MSLTRLQEVYLKSRSTNDQLTTCLRSFLPDVRRISEGGYEGGEIDDVIVEVACTLIFNQLTMAEAELESDILELNNEAR